MPLNRLRRPLAAAGALIAAVLVLSGCTTTSAGSASASGGTTLADVLKSKTLTVGMDLEYKPQMYVDGGKPAGYDVDLMKLMASDLGVKLDIQNQKFEALVPGLLAKKFDLISVGLVNTPERAKTVWFSDPYVPYNQNLMVSSKYGANTTVADLDKPGKTITVLTGSTAYELAKRSFQKATIQQLDQDAALLAVSSGKADATIAEEYLAKPYANSHASQVKIANNGSAFATQYGAYALPKGDVTWQEWVNNWIQYRTADGTLKAEYAKWIEPTLK
jgi:polar amino acid transport system substrate-binding protein